MACLRVKDICVFHFRVIGPCPVTTDGLDHAS